MNPNTQSIFGVGYQGIWQYTFKTDIALYMTFRTMHQRCYDPKVQVKYPTYEECTVAKRWHNFQNFCEDVEQMVGYKNLGKGWHLDKDILYIDNKLYSRKTCCLVPHTINTILTKSNASRGDLPIGVSLAKGGKYRARCHIKGKTVHLGEFTTPLKAFKIYKKAKEAEIKRVSNLYKEYLDPGVYEALMLYRVRIED